MNTAIFSQTKAIEDNKLPFTHFTMDNGLRVILQPDNNAQDVVIEFWVLSGSANEPVGKYGLAHLCEHATPYGLRNDSNLLKLFRATRINSNAQTRKDYIRYYVQVKPESLSLALQYTAERMNLDTAAITNDLFKLHKENVMAEMKRQEASYFNNPEVAALREQMTFGALNTYGHGPYGSLQEVMSLTKQDVQTWLQQQFTAGNMLLMALGKFDTSQLIPAIKKQFASIKIGKLKKSNTPWLQTTTALQTVNTSIQNNYYSETLFLPSAEKGWSYDELTSIILEKRIQQRKLLPSFTESGSLALYNDYYKGSVLGVYVIFPLVRDSTLAYAMIKNELNKIKTKGITKSELNDAQKELSKRLKSKLLKAGFNDSRAELFGEGLYFHQDPLFYWNKYQKQVNVSLVTFNKALKQILTIKRAPLLAIATSTAK